MLFRIVSTESSLIDLRCIRLTMIIRITKNIKIAAMTMAVIPMRSLVYIPSFFLIVDDFIADHLDLITDIADRLDDDVSVEFLKFSSKE